MVETGFFYAVITAPIPEQLLRSLLRLVREEARNAGSTRAETLPIFTLASPLSE